jgi:hypothetical protein
MMAFGEVGCISVDGENNQTGGVLYGGAGVGAGIFQELIHLFTGVAELLICANTFIVPDIAQHLLKVFELLC